MTSAAITVDTLRESEIKIRRAEGRVDTQRKRLAEQEALLDKEKKAHVSLVEEYGRQHCPEAT